MSGILLDDLGRVLAMPMPRSRALRLIGTTLFCAVFPRSAAANGCSGKTCPPTAPKLCCLSPSWNPAASLPACCTSDQLCCSGETPHGPAWAAVACCNPNEICIKTDAFVTCSPCPSGIACGGACCETGETCVNGTCCPAGNVCGNICCPPGSLCSSARSPSGKTRYVCFNRPRTGCAAACAARLTASAPPCERGAGSRTSAVHPYHSDARGRANSINGRRDVGRPSHALGYLPDRFRGEIGRPIG